jgi:hypothetical protein
MPAKTADAINARTVRARNTLARIKTILPDE